ncbi:MAG: hypothetical protein N2662_00315 [Bacteroidales bacterium]|nr:hypothetical protein [Bacteroidales bacterium]
MVLKKITKYLSKHIPLNQYNKDLLYNILSFGISAIVLLFISFLIMAFYKAEGLGYYSQVYAFYMVISQITAWGIHLSVQKYIPQFAEFERHRNDIFVSAIIATFIFSSIVSIIVAIYSHLPGLIVKSALIEKGFIFVTPGLIFFSLNKVFFAYLNGIGEMKKYAFFYALRFIIMLTSLIFIIFIKAPSIYLSFLLTIPEIIIFFVFIFSLSKYINLNITSRVKRFLFIHFKFGTNVAWGNIVLATKPDILIIGYFLTDNLVGIYSFGSTIIDGLIQLMFVFRTNINPVITNLFYHYEKSYMENELKKHITFNYKFFFILGIILSILYPFVLYFIGINHNLTYYYLVYYIILSGCIAASGYIPLQMIFNQTGFPKTQSVYLLSVFSLNVIVTAILTHTYGIIGSAISTSIMYLIQPFFLVILVKKIISVNINILDK